MTPDNKDRKASTLTQDLELNDSAIVIPDLVIPDILLLF
jgi:hypothetical protein